MFITRITTAVLLVYTIEMKTICYCCLLFISRRTNSLSTRVNARWLNPTYSNLNH